MQLDYRPHTYNGDACILMPSDRPLEFCQHDAWKSYINGELDFEVLDGNATDLLREPYTRDLAARILARIDTQFDSQSNR
jgi:thioesterase domain-containing protein